MGGWIVAICLFLFFIVAAWRAIELSKLIKEVKKDLAERDLDLELRVEEYNTLHRLYNQMVDTGLDLGWIIETSSGYLWRRPEMARGSKPYLATVKGKRVNF